MDASVEPGGVSSRVRWVIGGACAITVLIAAQGMQSLWDCVEWLDKAYGVRSPATIAFWYQHGLALGVTAALALAWLPRFAVSRMLRVAIVLPVIHLGAILVAGKLFSIFDADALAHLDAMRWKPEFMSYVKVAVPSISTLAVAFAAMIGVGVALKRRHGEWAHATVALALTNLLIVGLWLPFVARFAVQHRGYGRWWGHSERLLAPSAVAWSVIVPAAVVSLIVVTILFRRPQLFTRSSHITRTATIVGFVLALMVAVTLSDKSWLVYLESSYLVMTAVALAVASLVLLIVVTSIRSLLAHRRARGVTYQQGVIASDAHDDAQDEVARYEITSSLRGPRLVARPFVVTTAHGNVPVDGAQLLVPVPAASTRLDTGEHVGVLAAGDRVTLAVRTTSADGHPFRSGEHGDIVTVATPDARRFELSDVALVAWRPAVAYLAILVAVAAPYLTIFLTD